ncbi:hypothetical protein BGZ94_002056 [Podila epigama]|nr:hypothetical protein BGZ94_002056 [Podila epigama]
MSEEEEEEVLDTASCDEVEDDAAGSRGLVLASGTRIPIVDKDTLEEDALAAKDDNDGDDDDDDDGDDNDDNDGKFEDDGVGVPLDWRCCLESSNSDGESFDWRRADPRPVPDRAPKASEPLDASEDDDVVVEDVAGVLRVANPTSERLGGKGCGVVAVDDDDDDDDEVDDNEACGLARCASERWTRVPSTVEDASALKEGPVDVPDIGFAPADLLLLLLASNVDPVPPVLLDAEPPVPARRERPPRFRVPGVKADAPFSGGCC